MSREELVKLLYQDPQPMKEIQDKVLSKIETFSRRDRMPDKDGDYLVHHLVYGWCLYGFTTKDLWGMDDEVVRNDGSKYYKIVEWGKLDFLK